MDILGAMGQMYMFFLLALLILGCGFAAWGFIDNLHKKQDKPGVSKRPVQQIVADTKEKNETKGDISNNMKNNSWLKLAVFSLVGIFISIALLGFITAASGSGYGQMNNQNSMYNQQMNSNYNQMQQMQNQLNQMQQQVNNNQSGNMNGNNQGQNNMNNMQQNNSSSGGSGMGMM